MLAHELRNPLTPISAAADLLSLGNLPQERVKRTSDIIGRQVRHMTGLVDDLLDVSRVTRGLVALDMVELDGNELARRLRAQAETADSVLIAVTGYGQEQDRNQALAAGFNHRFVKPVDVAQLTALLNQASTEVST